MSGLAARGETKPLPPGFELPPGLDLPPGLPAPAAAPKKKAAHGAVGPPPGLHGDAAAFGRGAAARCGATPRTSVALDSEPMYVSPPTGAEKADAEPAPAWAARVLISGLPNKILPMIGAVLEQAGLEDAVLDVSTRPGKPCGDATVSLCSVLAAEQCAQHFQGCQWDPSGATVNVRLLSSPPSAEKRPRSIAAAAKEAKERLSGLSAKAPVFQPRLQEALAIAAPQKLRPHLGSSDASTEAGEASEPEDEPGDAAAASA